MQITVGGGTPIEIYPRECGGVLLMQGRSHIKLSGREIELLTQALAPHITTESGQHL